MPVRCLARVEISLSFCKPPGAWVFGLHMLGDTAVRLQNLFAHIAICCMRWPAFWECRSRACIGTTDTGVQEDQHTALQITYFGIGNSSAANRAIKK